MRTSKLSGFFAAILFLLLMSGSAFAQKINGEWKKPKDPDFDPLRMKLYFSEDFDTPPAGNTTALPAGWVQTFIKKTTSNAEALWTRAKGGGSIGSSRIKSPQNPAPKNAPSEYNLLCNYNDSRAIQRLITEQIDLSEPSEPKLVFWYASMEKTGVDALEVQYRFGTDDSFHSFPPEVGVFTEATGWKKVTIDLTSIKGANTNLKEFQLAFISKQNNGHGTCIDEIYIADMKGSQSEFTASHMLSVQNALPTKSKDNPIFRIYTEISSGGGGFFLTQAKFTIKTFNAGDFPIEKARLYRTRSYKFHTNEPVGELKLTKEVNGNETNYKVTEILWDDPNDYSKGYLAAGNRYYYWVAVDVDEPNNAAVKGEVWVDIDAAEIGKSGLVFTHVSEFDKAELPTIGSDNYVIPVESFTCSKVNRSIIFQTLFADDFENPSNRWSHSSETVWKIGTPSDVEADIPDKSQTQPRYAVSGDKVLATAVEKNGKLVGEYPRGIEQTDEKAWIQTPEQHDAKYYKELYQIMDYNINLKGNDALIVEARYKDHVDWTPMLTYGRSTMNREWDRKSRNITKHTARETFDLRLRLQTEAQGGEASGVFIDNFRLIGDLLANDVGITELKIDRTFNYGPETKVHGKVKNLGKQAVNKEFTVEFYIDGVKSSVTKKISGLAVDEEKTFTISGFNDFKPNELVNNEHQVTARVVLPAGVKDDDEKNNEVTLTFYAFPTIEVGDELPYPRRFGDPMRHWYAEPYFVGNDCSWSFGSVDQFKKSYDENEKLSAPFGVGMQLGHYIWTTGQRNCYRFEKSVLLSPIFKITTTNEQEKRKELVMSFVLHDPADRDQQSLHVEYTKDGETWFKLDKTPGHWEKNWYEPGEAFRNETGKYVFVKTELPEELQNATCQFRIVFENTGTSGVPGVAINGVEVRSLRPDLQIVAHSPIAGCDSAVREAPLLLQIKNTSQVKQEAFTLPVLLRVKFTPGIVGQSEQTVQVMKNVKLQKLIPGGTQWFDTEIFFPWTSHVDNKIEVEATLMPERSELRLADEDTENNHYQAIIEPKIPWETPVKNLQKDRKVYLSSFPGTVELQNKTMHGVGYHFSNFVLTPVDGEGEISGSNISVTKKGVFKLAYDVGDCQHEITFEVAQGDVDLGVQGLNLQTSGVCLPAGGKVDMNVIIRNEHNKAFSGGFRIEVRQSGRLVKQHDVSGVSIGKNKDHTVSIKQVPLRSGHSELTVEVIADGDVRAENNRKRMSLDKFAFPERPEDLDVFLQDAAREDYMFLIDPSQPVATYGDRDWNLYIPPIEGVSKVTWTQDGYPFNVEGEGWQAALADRSGAFQPTLNHPECGTFAGPIINVKADDIEMLGLAGSSGRVALCKSENGYDISIALRNVSRKIYEKGTIFGFEISCQQTGKSKIFDIALKEQLGQRSTITLDFGDQKLPSDFCKDNQTNTLTIKFLGELQSPGNYLEDANLENNTWVGDVEMSRAPDVYFPPEQQLVREVFQAGGMGVVYTLAPENTRPGYRYEWYSKLHGLNFNRIEGANEKTLDIYDIPDDIYRLVVTNPSGCATTIESEFVQTDVTVSGIVSPSQKCALTDNDGKVIIKLFNSGNRPLDSKQLNAKVTVQYIGANGPEALDLEGTASTGLIPVGEGLNVELKQVDLTEHLAKAQGRLGLSVKIEAAEGDWDVVESNNTSRKAVTAMGRPDAKIYLFSNDITVDPKAPVQADALFYYDPKNSSTDPTYSAPDTEIQMCVGGINTEQNERVKWQWQYGAGYEVKNLTPHENVQLMKIPTEEIKDWCKTNLKDPSGGGTYIISVVDVTKPACPTDIFLDIYFEELDLKIKEIEDPSSGLKHPDITLPKSACEFLPGKDKYQARVVIQNAGRKTIEEGTKLKVKLTPVYVAPSGSYRNHLKFTDTISDLCKPAEFDYTLQKPLHAKSEDVISCGVTLYKEHPELSGVNFLEGVKLKYEFEVLIDPEDKRYNEKNIGNNTMTSKDEVYIKPPIRIQYFNVKDAKEGSRKTILPNRSFTYEYEKPDPAVASDYIRIQIEPNVSGPSGFSYRYDWLLQGTVVTRDGNDYPTSVENKKDISVVGLGKVQLTAKYEEPDGTGCTDTQFLVLINNNADLMPESMISPDTTCLADIGSQEKKLKVRIANVSSKPFNIKVNDECKNSELTISCQLLDNLGNKLPNSTELKETKLVENIFTQKGLKSFKPNEFDKGKPVEDEANYLSEGQGLDGYGSLEYEMAQPMDLSPITAGGTYKVKVKIELHEKCADLADNNEVVFPFVVIDKPSMENLVENDYQFFVKENEAATVVLKEENRDKFKSFEWLAPNGNSLGTDFSAQISEAGQYTLRGTDHNSCIGTQTFNVRFPPYFQVVPESGKVVSAVAGKELDQCNISAGDVGFSFVVKNMGREKSEKTQSVQVNFALLTNGNLFKFDNTYKIGELAEGSGYTITSTPNDANPINLENKGEYLISVSIDPASDAAGLNVVRDTTRVKTGHWITPSEPDLREQVKNLLEYDKTKFEPKSDPSFSYSSLVLPKRVIVSGTDPSNYEYEDYALHLYGVNSEKVQESSVPSLSELEADGTTWTWMRDGKVLKEGKSEKDAILKVGKNELPGKFKVIVKTDHGCRSESEEIELRRLVEYKLEPATIEGVASTLCSESGMDEARYEVIVNTKIAEADEPLPAGTELKFSFITTPDGGASEETKLTAVTEKDFNVGDVLTATFKKESDGTDNRLTAGAGSHNVVGKVEFEEKYSKLKYLSGSADAVKFNVVKKPKLPPFANKIVHPTEKPYTIEAPSGIEPATPDGSLEYTWTGPIEGSGTSLQVSQSGTYTFHVRDVNTCEAQAEISVIYQYVITSMTYEPVDGGVANVYLLDDVGAISTEVEPVTGRIDDNRSVRIVPKPADGWKLRSIVVTPEGGDRIVAVPTADRPLKSLDHYAQTNFAILIRFIVDDKQGEDIEDPVRSALLDPVLAISPFDQSMVLFKTQDVASYIVYDSQGKLMAQSIGKLEGDQIHIDSGTWPEGIYLIRLVDRDGGVLTIKLVKQRK